MKPFWILIVVCLGLASRSALGQATFALKNNDTFEGIEAPIFDSQGIPLASTNYVAALYGGRTPDTLVVAVDAVSSARGPLILPFQTRGYIDQTSSYYVKVPGTAGGSYIWLQVRAWDARLGATYEAVVARGLGGYGESPLFYNRGGGGSPNGEEPGLLYGLKSFSLRAATGLLMKGIHREGDSVVVEWFGGFKQYQLQQSTNLNGPWINIGATTTATSVTNQIGSGAQFFRVVGLLN